LAEDDVEQGTQVRYQARLVAFGTWLSLRSLASVELLDPRELDDHAVTFLQVLYDDGAPQSHGKDLISALQWRRKELQHRLPAAWKAVTAWELAEPGDFRTPLPLEVALALVVAAITLRQGGLAACILLMFHCLLRPGEAAALCRRDLLLPSQRVAGRFVGIVAIRQPKTRRRGARVQSVLIEDPSLLVWLEWYVAGLPMDEPLLHGGYDTLAANWKLLLVAVGLPRSLFTPACARAGGATFDYIERGDVPDLLRRGRWRNQVTLDHYVQMAAAELVWNNLSHEQIGRVRRFAELAGPVLQPEGSPEPLRRRPAPRTGLRRRAASVPPRRA